MPARSTAKKPDASVALIQGDEHAAVKARAKQLYEQWCRDSGGEDHEIIDGQATNTSEALQSIGRLREAINTLPFFGGNKVVWWRGCSFFGEDRTSSTQTVSNALVELASELKTFSWDTVKLIVSAGKIDKRKSFYKTLSKIANVETFEAWTPDTRNWQAEAERLVRDHLTHHQMRISGEALSLLIDAVGPNRPQLEQELEKLSLFLGDRNEITPEDVEAVVTRNKQARAFALGDALGDRNLPRLLKTLDEELWSVQVDRQKSEIGLLFGLITKVRMMIFAKELLQEKLLRPARDYNSFKAQLERIPQERLPEDRRFNPLAMSPYPLFRATTQVRHYALEELVEAMNLLLDCNRRLIFSRLDGGMVLQQTLLKIVRGDRSQAARSH